MKNEGGCRKSNLGIIGAFGINKANYTLKVRFVAGNPNNKEIFTDPAYADNYDDCGNSVACIKTTNPRTYGNINPLNKIHNIFAFNAPAHLEDMSMVLEHPAYEYVETTDMNNNTVITNTRFFWSNDINRTKGTNWGSFPCNYAGKPASVTHCAFRYLPSLYMHEFGHTLGPAHLPNPYATGTMDFGLMYEYQKYATPTGADVNLVKTPYAQHTPHARTR